MITILILLLLIETIDKYCHVENYLEANCKARVIEDDYSSKYTIYGRDFSKSGKNISITLIHYCHHHHLY